VAGALTSGTASAATPSCGPACVSLYSPDFGSYQQPNFVLDTYKQGENLGQPIILFRTSNVDPAEDFYPTYQGDVASLLAAGLVSDAVALHYGCIPASVSSTASSGTSASDPIYITGNGTVLSGGSNFPTCADGASYSVTTGTVKNPVVTWYYLSDLSAVELEYAPFGVESGWCVGTATAATNGTKVSLQPCGVSSKTYWIWDDLQATYKYGQELSSPLINASTTNFSQPAVLTYPGSSYPTDEPRPQLYTQDLTGETNGGGVLNVGTVDDNQLWWSVYGALNN
jgi:hypothetical protein